MYSYTLDFWDTWNIVAWHAVPPSSHQAFKLLYFCTFWGTWDIVAWPGVPPCFHLKLLCGTLVTMAGRFPLAALILWPIFTTGQHYISPTQQGSQKNRSFDAWYMMYLPANGSHLFAKKNCSLFGNIFGGTQFAFATGCSNQFTILHSLQVRL